MPLLKEGEIEEQTLKQRKRKARKERDDGHEAA
jgi:hypothetical protein